MSNPNLKLPRGERGKLRALTIVEQTESLPDGSPDDSFITDHVTRKLRQQMREGIGTAEGQMPAAFATHLFDRAYGKESEKLSVKNPTRPYEDMSAEDLAKRLEQAAARVRKANPAEEKQ